MSEVEALALLAFVVMLTIIWFSHCLCSLENKVMKLMKEVEELLKEAEL